MLTRIVAKAITARYLNLFGKDPEKEKYAEVVYSMIQESYRDQDGMHGSGFRSPEDMVVNIPFWKLVRKNGGIVAGAMYKDKDGRKRVAVFQDGSAEGIAALREIQKADLDRGYVEISGKSLSFMRSSLGEQTILRYALPPDEVKLLLKDDEILPPDPNLDDFLTRFSFLSDFAYSRRIGSRMHNKVLLGTPGIELVFED